MCKVIRVVRVSIQWIAECDRESARDRESEREREDSDGVPCPRKRVGSVEEHRLPVRPLELTGRKDELERERERERESCHWPPPCSTSTSFAEIALHDVPSIIAHVSINETACYRTERRRDGPLWTPRYGRGASGVAAPIRSSV